MGKKKNKGKREESGPGEGDTTGQAQVTELTVKSKKKKKDFSDDYDEDLSALAAEMGLGSDGNQSGDTGEGQSADTAGLITLDQSGGLGEDTSRLDHLGKGQSADIAGLATWEQLTSPGQSGNTTELATRVKVSSSQSGCYPASDTAIGEQHNKKQSEGNFKLEVADSSSVPTVEGETSEAKSADIVIDQSKNEDEVDNEKKKKKKKKKKGLEEEKKLKGPSKAAISKIKKMQAALEEEKKRREEEALMAQRAEEERERARLEKLRLENERKERQKQKEKERKLKRKLEGKPVTKKEREAEARRQAHLAAMQEQGMIVPEKNRGEKKVVYGIRSKNKREKAPPRGIEEPSNAEGIENDAAEPVLKEDGCLESWEDMESWEDLDRSGSEEVKDLGHEVAEVMAKEVQSSEGESDSSSEDTGSSSASEDEDDLSPYEKAKLRIQKRRARHASECSADSLRSPVVCVLGHVDTGKTKILDKIRKTNVQDGEAGGITQQIGATFVPVEAVREQTKMLREFSKEEINLPGLLIIDTPGHESFRNLRSRGSSMCDLAILVVDIMHGLEPQTLESLNLLQKGNTPFVVALNKIDRLFDWHRNPSAGVRDTLKRQKPNTKVEFDERVKQVSTEFAEQGLNVALFWEKVDFSEYVPLVPTSAITGDGMGDLIALLVEHSLKKLAHALMLSMEVEAMVMEVKVIAGLGTTVDVILRNGVLQEGDVLILMSNEGPLVATVRALLMPQPLRELRVKNAYINHSAVMAAQGVKVTAKGELEKVLPGTSLSVAKKPDEIDVLKDEAAGAMKNVLNSIKLQERGVYVQASTLGSLEALLDFLTHSKIPYCGLNIGPVHKKDVMKASVMLEHDPQWAVILAFDVRVEREAQEMADNLSVKIFSADIIYHLFDSFLKHREELREKNRLQYQNIAVFPCKLRILPNCVFNTRDPIIVGVVVEAGVVKPGTPLTVPSKEFTDIGVVASLEVNHKSVDVCRKGVEVCVKIEHVGGDAPRLYGRHFDHTDLLVSKVSRESIDAVKNYFREDLNKADWQLMIELKKMFQIM